jgi:hypothetical protein
MSKTAHEIMTYVVPIIPRDYKTPTNKKMADRDRAKFIFDQQPDLMRLRRFDSAEQLVQKYWADPHGLLPLLPNEP